ncbi:MAG: hypothetical protein Q9227_002203 [Pyrenula ochraceoflavens]
MATPTTTALNHSTHPAHNSPTPMNQNLRGKRRGRGIPREQPPPRGRGQPHTGRTYAGRRQFGGQLTQLHGDAPEFVPSQTFSNTEISHTPSSSAKDRLKAQAAVAPKTTTPASIRQKQKTLLQGSTAPDLATRIHEDIARGIYECAICTNGLGKNSKVWACHTCWAVFHLSCIRKWSKNEGSAVAQQRTIPAEELPPPKQWRCPGCNLPKDSQPSTYTCWCEKETDPQNKPCHRPGVCEDADSVCQQVCGKSKKLCGHPCEKVCHAPSACREDKPCPFKIIVTCECQRRKEEVRCNVWSGSPTATHPKLKCDDECARLERNRQLRVALEIPDEHTDDHVPYSNATLQAYATLDLKWSHRQEDALRIFAADESEKRYRFNPMRAHQRAFIHSLCEDFGFDSESLDPEPHRHVLVFKTPRFTAAPMKSLGQAARLRKVANQTPPAQIDNSKAPDTTTGTAHPSFNGVLLDRPKFALTLDELRPHLRKNVPTMHFDIHFLTDRDAVALIPNKSHHQDSIEDMENLLHSVKPQINSSTVQERLVSSCHLCSFSTQAGADVPKIVFVEQSPSLLNSGAGAGWSQIAGRKAASAKMAPTTDPVGQRPIYTVLGSKLAEAKKKKQEEERLKKLREKEMLNVAENWDDEAEDSRDGN